MCQPSQKPQNLEADFSVLVFGTGTSKELPGISMLTVNRLQPNSVLIKRARAQPARSKSFSAWIAFQASDRPCGLAPSHACHASFVYRVGAGKLRSRLALALRWRLPPRRRCLEIWLVRNVCREASQAHARRPHGRHFSGVHVIALPFASGRSMHDSLIPQRRGWLAAEGIGSSPRCGHGPRYGLHTPSCTV